MNIETLLGLKLSDWASIVFGTIAVIFSLASYRRAKLSEMLSIESNERVKRAEDRSNTNEMRARELTFAQHKSAALDLVSEGEVARIAAVRRLHCLRAAALEAGASEVLVYVDKEIAGCEESLVLIRNLRVEVESATIAGDSHEELLIMIDKSLVNVKRVCNGTLFTEELGQFIDQVERNIRAAAISKEVAQALSGPDHVTGARTAAFPGDRTGIPPPSQGGDGTVEPAAARDSTGA